MKNLLKQGIRMAALVLCVMLVSTPAAAFAADNLFVQMEADGVYQQYADLMDVSVAYQDEKKLVWEFICTAVELQNQAMAGGTEKGMPEDMARYMDDHHLEYDVTGAELLQSAEQWDQVLDSLHTRLNTLQSELNQVLTEADGIASMYSAGSYSGGGMRSGGLLSGGGMGKLIVGILIGVLIGSAGATAAGRNKKNTGW